MCANALHPLSWRAIFLILSLSYPRHCSKCVLVPYVSVVHVTPLVRCPITFGYPTDLRRHIAKLHELDPADVSDRAARRHVCACLRVCSGANVLRRRA
jgi:hypothetical protein